MSWSTIIMMAISYTVLGAAVDTSTCQAAGWFYESYVAFDRSSLSCSYIEKMDLLFTDEVISLTSTIHNERYTFTNFPQGFTLKATGLDYKIRHANLKSIVMVTPPQKRFADITKELHAKSMEMQLYFDVDMGQNTSQVAMNHSVVSLIFAPEYPEGTYYLPDGSEILRPLYPYGLYSVDETSTVDINLKNAFSEVVSYYHQWYVFPSTVGKGDCQNGVNWYVNSQLFHVQPSYIQRYQTKAPSLAEQEADIIGGVVEGDTVPVVQQGYSFTTLKPVETPVTAAEKAAQEPVSLVICYSGLEETIMRENYALWLWVLGIFVWWIVTVVAENDTQEVFVEDFDRINWTQMPWYSVYKMNNDIFFTKLSRYLLILVIFSWEVTILSVLWGQFKTLDKYEVGDAIILWYAIVALVVGWPVAYFFGAQLYHVRETWKEMMYLKIEWKKIIDKTQLEAVELYKGVELEEDRMFTQWYLFYTGLLLLLIADFCISIWQNTFLTRDEQDYWVATIFLMLFLDFICDLVVACFPGPRWTKYRGFFYDVELGKLYKQLEEC